MKKVLFIFLLFTLIFSSVFFGEAIKRGGIVNVTSTKQGVLVKNFNPFSPNCVEVTIGGFYETLIYFNPMNGSVIPWLAKNYSWSKDLKEITFTLNEGVQWNDGFPFTVEDVLFTFELSKNNKALDFSGIWSQGLKEVVSKTADSVTFIFEEVNTTLIQNFSSIFIVPKHIWENVQDPITWTGNNNPVGTGPFVFEEGSFTELSYKVVSNPKYWQIAEDGKPLPYIAGIQFLSTTNEQVGFRLINNEFDWAGFFVANIDKVFVESDPEHHKYWLPEGNMVFLNLNNLKWPFDEYKVRLAFAYAMDTEEITRIMASGAVAANISGVKSSYLFLAKDALEKYAVEYDPDYAQTLLEEAGYSLNARGIYQRDGKELSLKLYVPTGWTDWVTGCEVIASQLKDIGVEALVTQAAWPTPYKDNLFTGDYEICLGISVTGANPHYQYTMWMHSQFWAPLGQNTGNYYGMRYKNQEIDKLLDLYRQEPNEKVQDELMSKAIELFLKDMPSVALFFNPVWFEYNTMNFIGWPNKEDPYAQPRVDGMDKLQILFRIHQK